MENSKSNLNKFYIATAYLVLVCVCLNSCGDNYNETTQAVATLPCENPGWYPTEFGLKDHQVFWYDGYYYLVSILFPSSTSDPLVQDRFAYTRSKDLCEREDLGPILPLRTPGAPNEAAIWAPNFFYEDDTNFIYYTGITSEFIQSILLATTTDPWFFNPIILI